MMIPPMVAPLPSHQSTGTPMSYATQWAANVAPHGLSQNAVSPQGDLIQNHNLYSSVAYNPNTTMRQHGAPLQLSVNQQSPTQNNTGYCPTQIPSGYSFVHPAILATLAAQQNANQSRTHNYCVQQGSNPSGSVRGALLSSPAYQHVSPSSHINHQQTLHSAPALQYIQTTLNGLQLAAFPGGTHTAANCSFQHASHLSQHGPQQQTGAMATQFRSYESLKHFGALPQPQNHKRNKSMTTSRTNLYISGLTESDTDETVRALVENIVRPKSCKAMLLNGKCKGSGFIDCATEDDAVKALNHLSEVAKNGGRKLNVKYALENEKDLLNVYVRNLPRTGFTKETLENLFKPYGQVTSVKLLETDGAYTGIGFVRFASAEQAQRAVESMNEARCVLVDGPGGSVGKPICCKLADKADPKRRALNAAAALAAAAMANHSSVSSNGGVGANPPLRKPHDQSMTNNHQPNSSHLQHQSQQGQPTMPGIIFPSGVLTDGGLMSLAAYPSIPGGGGFHPQLPQSSTDNHQPLSSSPSNRVGGLYEMLLSSPISQSQQDQLNGSSSTVTQPAAINLTHMDSRYAVAAAQQQLAAAAAAASNVAMYSNGQFSRPASHHQQQQQQQQQQMVHSAYTYPSPHQQYIQYPHAPSTTPDSTALVSELQQLSLHRPTPPQSDWQSAVSNPTVSAPNGVMYYQAATLYNQQSSPVIPVVPVFQEVVRDFKYPPTKSLILEERGVVIEEIVEVAKEVEAMDQYESQLSPTSSDGETKNDEDASTAILCSATTTTTTTAAAVATALAV